MTIRRILVALVIALAALGFANASHADAPNTHWCASVGEFQHVVIPISRGCRLDVYLVPGRVGGLTASQRCANRGDTTLTATRFRGRTYLRCRGVDF